MSQPIPNKNNPLETERIGKLLPRYAIPSVVSLLISSLYNIVDQIFVGHGVGYLGNCATSIVFPLTVIGLAFAVLIGDGTAAHLSLCQGRGDTEGFDRCLGNGLLAGTVISILYMAIFFLFTDEILTTFGATEVTLPYVKAYGTIIFWGMPFFVISNLLSAVIRADGSPQRSLFTMASGAVFNIIFDPVLIFVFDMGVEGAAIATIGGQIISAVMAVDYLRKSKTFRLHKSSFRFQPSALATALPLGISSFLTQLAIVLTSAVSNAQLVVYGASTPYGSDIPIAVMGIVMKVFAICVSVSIGLAVGAQPIVGYNYSAGNYERVKAAFNLVTVITVVVCLIATGIFELFPHVIIRIFGNEGPAYTEFAIICFQVYLCCITFTCFQKISGVFLQALGKPILSIIVSISRDLVFQLFFLMTLPKVFGLMGLLYAGPAADVLAFLVSFAFIAVQIKKLGQGRKEISHE